MEEAINRVNLELDKIKKIHKTDQRVNVSGLRKVGQWGRDKEFGKFRKLGNFCESINFGIQEIRFNKKPDRFQPSKWNDKLSDLYQSLLELALYIIPEDLEMKGLCNITLNHNLKCLPHTDKNKGDSIIIGLGEYTGGRLILHHSDNELEYIDIHNKPFKFNGRNIKHSTDEFEGDRWSVIYYT